MNREEKRRRTILKALAALAADESGELAKLRRLRSGLYWVGAILLVIGVYADALVPGWVTLLWGAVGGLVIGLAVHYDNSLNQWPTLRPFVDGQAAQRAAAALDEEPGDGA